MLKKVSKLLLEKGLEENEIYVVADLASPTREEYSGKLMIDVTFCPWSDSLKRFPVSVPWCYLSDFWIGRIFIGGEPADPLRDTAFIVINMSEINDCSINTFRDVGISYGLSQNEFCVSFTYNDERFVIPCMEIVRGFFSYNKRITDSLLRLEGVENLVQLDTWEESNAINGEAAVKFAYYRNTPFSGEVLSGYRLAEILGSETLLHATRKIQQSNRLYGKIKIDIPLIEDGIIIASTIFNLRNVNLIGEICPYIPVKYHRVTVLNRVWNEDTNHLVGLFEKHCMNFNKYNSNRILRGLEDKNMTPILYRLKDMNVFYRQMLMEDEKKYKDARLIPQYEDCLIPFGYIDINRGTDS